MKYTAHRHHPSDTRPCRKRGCPRDCQQRVVIREVPWPPFKLAMHVSEYLDWLETQPDDPTHPSA